jgi:hypothetical protein
MCPVCASLGVVIMAGAVSTAGLTRLLLNPRAAAPRETTITFDPREGSP